MKDPVCMNLLKLVSRGHAIIAEMNRLSDHIPSVFRMETKEDQIKYGDIIVDFRYLSQSEFWDHKIDSKLELLDLMEEFRETHIEILRRFYMMFESVYRYAHDLVQFCEQVRDGIYVSHTLETILNDLDSRQLFIESVHLYGVMLLTMDIKIDGPVRERILIAFYRAKGPVELTDIDEVCKLCRSTGWTNFNGWGKKPPNYPEDFFNRVPLPKDVVHLMLGRLRNDDLYLQLKYYPAPEQRSTALSTMAGMCFTILFFVPDVLQKQNATMNELVNRFFYDNWVISYYMGNRVDLTAAWDGYKAAKTALASVLSLPAIQQTIDTKAEMLAKLTKDVNGYLSEGVLNEEYVIDHIADLLGCLRNSNCTLRWIMLHLTTSNKKYNEIISRTFNQQQVLSFLLIVAQLELTMKTLFNQLLATKQSRWDKLKGSCTEIITELADFFSGNTPMSKISKNEDLEHWFREILAEITNLDYREPMSAGRKAAKMIAALEEVEQFQQIESSLQIRQYLADVRTNLTLMIRTIGCREDTAMNISVVSDMAYAWETAASYIQLMQQTVKRQANIVSKLRATFLKLSTMLEFPLMRIIQGKSPDQESVAEYYSSKLVAFVRSVLEVVPVSLFQLMGEIIQLQTRRMKEVPPKFAKDSLKDYAQLELRTELARLTHSVVSFTDGILEMETTTMGIIEVDPKKLLEDGVRNQLVKTIATVFNKALTFPLAASSSSSSSAQMSARMNDFEMRLTDVSMQIDGLKQSFEYVQDYIGIYGLKIWQEEIQRMANFYVEQECNSFLKKKVFEWQSEYQNEAAPIPLFPPTDNRSVTFIGRVTRELIELTSPSRCIYSTRHTAWIDTQLKTEVAGGRLFALMYSALDVALLSGVDKLLSFLIASSLSALIRTYRRVVDKPMSQNLAVLASQMAPPGATPVTSQMINSRQGVERQIPQVIAALVDTCMKIGHYQLLRTHVQSRLRAACHLESGVLAGTLSNFNRAILLDVERHYAHPDTAPYPSADSQLLTELSKYLEAAGMGDPISRVYVAGDPLPSFDFVVFVCMCSVVSRMNSDRSMGNVLVGKWAKETVDGVPFAVGMATLLKQFHSSYTAQFLERYGQLVRALYTDFGHTVVKEEDITTKTRVAEPPSELQNLVRFAAELRKHMALPDDAFENVVPKNLFESL